jgi:hypothetical protein
LKSAGFEDIHISSRGLYVVDNGSAWREGFAKRKLTAMVEEVSQEVLKREMIDEQASRKGIEDLQTFMSRLCQQKTYPIAGVRELLIPTQ